MGVDMTAACDDGYINIRVGAIIMRHGKILMVGNDSVDYLYSVGGRVQFGETAEEAVIREVLEETGTHMEVDRLGFIHENYFTADSPEKCGKLIYEISLYFYMKVPENFQPISNSFAEDNRREYLEWVDLYTRKRYYPEFFRTALTQQTEAIRYFVTDER